MSTDARHSTAAEFFLDASADRTIFAAVIMVSTMSTTVMTLPSYMAGFLHEIGPPGGGVYRDGGRDLQRTSVLDPNPDAPAVILVT